jgi:8-oxo-dGTP pyrophosphatase MutT (NUDIX family)
VPDPGASLVEHARGRLLAAGRYEYREHDFVVTSFEGGGRRLVRHVVHRGDSAYVLPVDWVSRRVALCRQFRAGKYLAGSADGCTLEAPGGLIELGADPAQTARRECAEELGVVATDLRHVATVMPHPALLPERSHLYIGTCSLATRGAERYGRGSDEETELVVMSFDQLRSAAADGGVDDTRTLLLSSLLLLPPMTEEDHGRGA